MGLESMKPLILYHDNCADGFGAAFAAWCKFGDNAEYVPCQYGKLDMECIDASIKDREVYILDFSFPRDVMDSIFATAKHVTWLDHHKTAFEDHGFTINAPGEPAIEPLSKHTIILDNCQSGAMLAWKYFHPNYSVPRFIRHIDDYDRWQFKIDYTKEFNKALWSYAPWSFEQWNKFFFTNDEGIHDIPIGSFYTTGKDLLRDHNQKVADMAKKAEKCSIEKHGPADDGDEYTYWQVNGLIVNCPSFLASDVGHELAVKSGTFGLTWMFKIEDGKQIAACSLRSNDEYDVATIAKAFGGGGHRNAAGFSVPISTLLGWIK